MILIETFMISLSIKQFFETLNIINFNFLCLLLYFQKLCKYFQNHKVRKIFIEYTAPKKFPWEWFRSVAPVPELVTSLEEKEKLIKEKQKEVIAEQEQQLVRLQNVSNAVTQILVIGTLNGVFLTIQFLGNTIQEAS